MCLYGYHVHDCGLSTEARSVWSLELDLQAVVSHLKWGREPNSSPLQHHMPFTATKAPL